MAVATKPVETKSKSSAKIGDAVVSIDRRRDDRRGSEANPKASATKTEPRRKQQRRRHIDPTTCEREYSEQEVEFMRAMDDYKRQAGRMFPTCSEVLEVIRDLGYVQLTEEQYQQLGIVEIESSEEVSDEDDFDRE